MAAPLFLSAQETYPLTKYLGQFFEQGYGNEGDEENLDLAAEGQKLYHAGWSYTLPEDFDTTGVHFADYSQFNLDATFRLTDKIGEQQWQVRIPGPQDEVARGIIPSINPDFNMAAVVRQTDLYRPQEWVRPADQLYLYLLDAGGTYDPLYVHEEQGLAPVDIQTGEDHYYVLANAMDENQFTYPTLLKISQTGNLIWQRNFKVEGMNVLTHELVVTENQELFFPVNYVDEGLAGVVGFNTAGQQLNDPQHVPTQAYLYGIAADGSNRLWTAGYEFSEPADTNALISRFTANGLYDQHWQKGNSQGQQKFRDLVLHDQGLQALGTRTDTTEGSASVYVSHLDNQVNEYYYDVMGSPNRDRVSSLILKPETPVTTFAGRHTGYGVYESGNAYLGGILIENPNLNGSTCKLNRFLYVEFMESYRDQGVNYIDPVNSILGNSAKENALVNYLNKNNINFVKGLGVDRIFVADKSGNLDFTIPASYSGNVSDIKADLNDFLARLSRNGVTVGLVVGKHYKYWHQEITTFNLDADIQRNGYNNAGKLRFLSYEYEFWNEWYNDSTEFWSGYTYNVTPSFPWHVDGFKDFLNNLDKYNTQGNKSANNWEIYTYIGRFNAKITQNNTTPAQQQDDSYSKNANTQHLLYTGFGDWNATVKSNLINNSQHAWRAKVRKIERRTDAIFFYQGVEANNYDETDFLNDGESLLTDMTSNSNVLNPNAMAQRKALYLLGSSSNISSYYIPIFYKTFKSYTNSQGQNETVCNGKFKDYLGSWLESYPDNIAAGQNSGNTFRKAEAKFMDQYDLIYQKSVVANSSISGSGNSGVSLKFNDLDNVRVVATSWFVYKDCFPNNLFSQSQDYGRVNCQSYGFGSPLSGDGESFDANIERFSVYPNPISSKSELRISGLWNGSYDMIILNSSGQEVFRDHFISGNNGWSTKIPLESGFYILWIVNEDKKIQKKKKLLIK